MKFRTRSENTSALTAVLFAVTLLSQSTRMVDENVHVNPTLCTLSSLSFNSPLPWNQVEEFCSVITASHGGTVLFGGNVDLRLQKISDKELNITYFPACREGYGFVTLGRDWEMKGYHTRVNSDHYAGMNEQGLAFAGSGVPLTPLNPHPERPFSGSPRGFSIKAMRECSNVASVIEFAQNFDWGNTIAGQFHFADSTGDAVVISGGKDGEIAFTRKEKGDGYLVSTNFNLTTKSGHYPCWRYDTAETMLKIVGDEHDLTTDYVASVLDAIHVEGMLVDTAVSYIFDLNNGDIYVYYVHQFGDVFKMNLKQKMAEIDASSRFFDSVFSAPVGGDDAFTSRTYFFHQLFYQETIEKGGSEIQKYERQYHVCMAAGVIVGAVILSGLSLFIYRKLKNYWKKPSPPEKNS